MNILVIGGLGYVGSRICKTLAGLSFNVTAVDDGRRGSWEGDSGLNLLKQSYNTLSEEAIQPFDAVLWFGGHSSVPSSTADPSGAVRNNCTDLIQLVEKINPDVPFIYASTGSLYSRCEEDIVPSSESELVRIPDYNAYDCSKFAFDYLLPNIRDNFFGLRFGTVSGFSSSLRPELIFNKMNIDAFFKNKIELMNPNAFRSILFLNDLERFIESLLTFDLKPEPGFYNLSSWTGRIGDLANLIGSIWDAPIVDLGESRTYSFMLDCKKASCLIPSMGTQDSRERVVSESTEFIESIRKSGSSYV
jgi:UDP-glucose 4-epimerase